MTVFTIVILIHALLMPLLLLPPRRELGCSHTRAMLFFFFCFLAVHSVGYDPAVTKSKTASGAMLSLYANKSLNVLKTQDLLPRTMLGG